VFQAIASLAQSSDGGHADCPGWEEDRGAAQYVEMKVPLYSYGCEKKIKKALSHLKGAYIDLELDCALRTKQCASSSENQANR